MSAKTLAVIPARGGSTGLPRTIGSVDVLIRHAVTKLSHPLLDPRLWETCRQKPFRDVAVVGESGSA